MLPVVHNFADRRFALGGDFHEIEAAFIGKALSVFNGRDIKLGTVDVDKAYLRDTNLFVNAQFFKNNNSPPKGYSQNKKRMKTSAANTNPKSMC